MSDSRYRITERVAAGGMAEVFRGVAESIQGFRKNVAIKRVLPALTKNKKFVAMFLDEARLSLHLQHANIVQVFDIGHTDETYFIVMEYVEGVDLKRLLEWRRKIGRPLTIGQTVYSIMEVCKGLSYAHEAVHPETGRPLGIVHRDVSPPNVLLSRNGEIKVTDFGLAKAAVQVETTDPGVVKGKMSYLSPEAARGAEVDRRADIFAVGILLYEMLTGKRLFYGETDYQTVELVRAAKIPPIATQNPEVEPELEEVVRKALARRPDDRFQSATDLQDALAHYLFSRGLKMIQRDISELVRACSEEQPVAAPAPVRKPRGNVIDTMLQDEIDSFESVGFDEQRTTITPPPESHQLPALPGQGASPGDFVDPRGWADETARANLRAAREQAARTGQPGVSQPRLPTGAQPLPPGRSATGGQPVMPPPPPPGRSGRQPTGAQPGVPPMPPPMPGRQPTGAQPALPSAGRRQPTGTQPVPPPLQNPGAPSWPGIPGGPPQGAAPLSLSAAGAPPVAPTAAPPAPGNPILALLAGVFSGKTKPDVAGFKPTPAPERLADVLEPRGLNARRLSKRLFVGVIAGALAFGALVAWLFSR
jgi:serine/threonine protein kinase